LREFFEESNQQAAPIYLQGGQRYYLEGLMQQAAAGDNLTVQWQLPNGTVELPLGQRQLGWHGCSSVHWGDHVPGIYTQPATTQSALKPAGAVFSLLRQTRRTSVTNGA